MGRKKTKRTQQHGKTRATQADTAPTSSPDATMLNPRWLLGAGALVLLSVFWAYWPTLREVFAAWVKEPDYSHGFLVAPLAILFLWIRREEFPRSAIQPSIAGLALLVVCCGLRYTAGKFFMQPLDCWTIPLWVMGSVWVLLGWPCLRWSLPSVIFLWFMFPLPYTAESWLSVPLQSLATKLSTASLVMLGQPALAEGNTIWLGDEPMFVEEACSGLRIFVGIFALAFAYILFSRWAWWQKLLVLVAALPIAILANLLRVVGTGLIYQWVSGEAGRSFSHNFLGIVMIPIAAAIFWLFHLYLNRLFPEVELLSPVMQRVASSDPASRDS